MSALAAAAGAVPVIELARLRDLESIDALRRICHEVGLFYLAVGCEDWAACEAMAAASRTFFASDAATKAKIGYERSPAFRGYMRLGAENTAGVVDRREQIELGREDGVTEGEAVALCKRLVGPNQLTEDLAPAAAAWLEAMNGAARALTRALAVALGLDAGALDAAVLGPKPHWQAKTARYPAGPGQGVGAHTDSGWLTLLWQDEAGLEARVGEAWVPIAPKAGCLVVNLGEMLQLASAGYFLATPHRVRSPPKDRLSLPFFYNPSLDAVVDRVVDPANIGPWSRPPPDDVAATDSHGAGRNKLVANYGINAFKSLARSHPKVFEKHHADLVVLPDGTVIRRCWGTLASG